MRKILYIILLITILLPFNLVLAENLDSWWMNVVFSGQEAGYETENLSGAPAELNLISVVISIALSFLGVIFLVLMIYAGYLWMTARGNEEQATKARNTITAAIIGLVIVLAAYAISYFVISRIGGASLGPAAGPPTD
ncbi:MAG: hypothetical protein ABIE43_01390 [Patescibacteria group bacterium]